MIYMKMIWSQSNILIRAFFLFGAIGLDHFTIKSLRPLEFEVNFSPFLALLTLRPILYFKLVAIYFRFIIIFGFIITLFLYLLFSTYIFLWRRFLDELLAGLVMPVILLFIGEVIIGSSCYFNFVLESNIRGLTDS